MSDLINLDDLDLDSDVDNDGGDKPNPVKDLRAKLKRLDKEHKAAVAELEELRKFKTETETASQRATVAQQFSSLGLPDAYAELYPGDAEATPEAIKGFALKYGWIQPEAEESDAEDQTAPTFSPVQIQGTSPVKGEMTEADLDKLVASGNLVAAAKAISEGRVSDIPPNADTFDW